MLNKKEIQLNNEVAFYYSIENVGTDAHFFPGNGLPIGVYKPLLDLLSKKFKLTSLAFRASWKNSKKQNKQVKWEVYANDLINFIEKKYQEPIIGIAHSQGANATIIAASKRPDLFKELYLIDPVCVTKFEQKWISLVPYILKKNMEPFKSSLKKKSVWNNPEEYFLHLQKSKGYKRIKEENLKLFANESLTLNNENKYELIFPKDWETANYALPINFEKELKSLKIPYKIILGKPSVFVSKKVRSNWNEFAKENIVVNTNFGHLIPLEAPEFCFEQIEKTTGTNVYN